MGHLHYLEDARSTKRELIAAAGRYKQFFIVSFATNILLVLIILRMLFK